MTAIGGVPNARPDSEEAIGLVVNRVQATDSADPSVRRLRTATFDAQWHTALDGLFVAIGGVR